MAVPPEIRSLAGVSMFEKHKAKRAAEALSESEAAWQQDHDSLAALLDLVEGRDSNDAEAPIVLKRGEHLLLVVHGAGLFESRRGAGHWEGRSQGVSIPLGHSGLRYRVGRSHGHYVQGAETPTIIDQGDVVITDHRVVFVGMVRSTEWAFAKLVSVQHDEERPWTTIAVENRQKVSGFLYDVKTAGEVRSVLEVAVGLFNGEGDHSRPSCATSWASTTRAIRPRWPRTPPRICRLPPRQLAGTPTRLGAADSAGGTAPHGPAIRRTRHRASSASCCP